MFHPDIVGNVKCKSLFVTPLELIKILHFKAVKLFTLNSKDNFFNADKYVCSFLKNKSIHHVIFHYSLLVPTLSECTIFH